MGNYYSDDDSRQRSQGTIDGPAFQRLQEPQYQRPWYAGTDSRDERTGVEMAQARQRQADQAGVSPNDPVQRLFRFGAVGSSDAGPQGVPSPRDMPKALAAESQGRFGGRDMSRLQNLDTGFGAFMTGREGAMPDSSGGGFVRGNTAYNVNDTSQAGIQRVTARGTSPLYTNINPADAVAGLGNQPVGGDAAAVNEGLKRHAEMIANRDKDIPAGGYGPGILGDGSLGTLPGGQSIEEWNRNVGVKTQLGLSPKDRVAYEDAAAKNEVQRRGQDFNRETSLNNSGLAAQVANNRDQVTMRGQDINERGDRLRYGNPLDIQAKQLSLTQAQRLSDIQGKYLNGTPEEKARAAEQIRALSGKDNQQSLKDNFMTAGGGQEFDEKAGIMRNVPQRLIDLRTGQDVSGQQQGPKRIGNSPYDEGASIVGKDGKKYVVRNGQPVLAQ